MDLPSLHELIKHPHLTKVIQKMTPAVQSHDLAEFEKNLEIYLKTIENKSDFCPKMWVKLCSKYNFAQGLQKIWDINPPTSAVWQAYLSDTNGQSVLSTAALYGSTDVAKMLKPFCPTPAIAHGCLSAVLGQKVEVLRCLWDASLVSDPDPKVQSMIKSLPCWAANHLLPEVKNYNDLLALRDDLRRSSSAREELSNTMLDVLLPHINPIPSFRAGLKFEDNFDKAFAKNSIKTIRRKIRNPNLEIRNKFKT